MDNTWFVLDLFGKPIVITGWKVFGFIGVLLFSGRWAVQMYYSARARKPVTPRLFWVMSIIGSAILLAYFALSPKQDCVGVVSNLFPCVIAGFNLYLDMAQSRVNTFPAAVQNQ